MKVAHPRACGWIQDHKGGKKGRKQRRGAPGARTRRPSVEQRARGEGGGGGEGRHQVRRELAPREGEEDEHDREPEQEEKRLRLVAAPGLLERRKEERYAREEARQEDEGEVIDRSGARRGG